jgi:SRSO17 transposase
VLLVRFRSIRQIATRLANGAVDTLHHFAHDSPWQEETVERAQQEAIGKRARHHRAATRLILDDTPFEREGKHIEGLGVHHGAKGLVKGLCAVTAVVRIGRQVWCWAIRGYRPKRGCPPGTFRSKIELALEVLEQAALLGANVFVLMDAWYSCKRVLNRIAWQGWRYVAAIKSNRRLRLEGRKTLVRFLAKGPRTYRTVRLSKRLTVRVARREAVLPGVGPVAVFIVKAKEWVSFLVSNDLELTPQEAVRLYAERFRIETFHRDAKQHLGLGELWVRSWRAVQRHWTLCGLAYNALLHWELSQHHRRRPFGQIIRAFRKEVSLSEVVRWHQRLIRVA